jgi:hypothetical protein
VPRDFLNGDDNTLVVFEEFGGNPWNVKFQTVTVGSACANAYEGNTLELACQGGNVISQIRFASFGSPKGACGSFGAGQCESPSALSIIQKVISLVFQLIFSFGLPMLFGLIDFFFFSSINYRRVSAKKGVPLMSRKATLDLPVAKRLIG